MYAENIIECCVISRASVEGSFMRPTLIYISQYPNSF